MLVELLPARRTRDVACLAPFPSKELGVDSVVGVLAAATGVAAVVVGSVDNVKFCLVGVVTAEATGATGVICKLNSLA